MFPVFIDLFVIQVYFIVKLGVFATNQLATKRCIYVHIHKKHQEDRTRKAIPKTRRQLPSRPLPRPDFSHRVLEYRGHPTRHMPAALGISIIQERRPATHGTGLNAGYWGSLHLACAYTYIPSYTHVSYAPVH